MDGLHGRFGYGSCQVAVIRLLIAIGHRSVCVVRQKGRKAERQKGQKEQCVQVCESGYGMAGG